MKGYIENGSQEERILHILRNAANGNVNEGWIDGMFFLRLPSPITQYHARIFGLQKKGHKIEGRLVAGKNWKEYRLSIEPKQDKLL